MACGRISARLALVGLVVACGAATALAQSPGVPARLEHFRFLPRASVVNEHGGFAGFNTNYRVRGEFDLATNPFWPGGPGDFDPSAASVQLLSVDARGFNPHRGELDVDLAMGLEGLVGHEVKTPSGASGVYRFRGETQDGSTVELLGKRDGAWLYLRGETTPPPGSADFFEYTIRALARRGPWADFNDDGAVDGADLAAWRGGAGDGGDFLAWQRQLGETPPDMASLDAAIDAALVAASESAATPVPEPAAWILAVTAAGLLARRRF